MNVGLNVTYNYQVDAVDLGGLRSAKSNTAAITRRTHGDAGLHPRSPIPTCRVTSPRPTTAAPWSSRPTPRPIPRASCASTCRASTVLGHQQRHAPPLCQQRLRHRLRRLPAGRQHLDRNRHHLQHPARRRQPGGQLRQLYRRLLGPGQRAPARHRRRGARRRRQDHQQHLAQLQQPRGRQPAAARGQHLVQPAGPHRDSPRPPPHGDAYCHQYAAAAAANGHPYRHAAATTDTPTAAAHWRRNGYRNGYCRTGRHPHLYAGRRRLREQQRSHHQLRQCAHPARRQQRPRPAQLPALRRPGRHRRGHACHAPGLRQQRLQRRVRGRLARRQLDRDHRQLQHAAHHRQLRSAAQAPLPPAPGPA